MTRETYTLTGIALGIIISNLLAWQTSWTLLPIYLVILCIVFALIGSQIDRRVHSIKNYIF